MSKLNDLLSSMIVRLNNSVRFDKFQSLSAAQKMLVRNSIGAGEPTPIDTTLTQHGSAADAYYTGLQRDRVDWLESNTPNGSVNLLEKYSSFKWDGSFAGHDSIFMSCDEAREESVHLVRVSDVVPDVNLNFTIAAVAINKVNLEAVSDDQIPPVVSEFNMAYTVPVSIIDGLYAIYVVDSQFIDSGSYGGFIATKDVDLAFLNQSGTLKKGIWTVSIKQAGVTSMFCSAAYIIGCDADSRPAWSDIRNRPFGETKVYPAFKGATTNDIGDTISWCCVPNEECKIVGDCFVRVSDVVIPKEAFYNNQIYIELAAKGAYTPTQLPMSNWICISAVGFDLAEFDAGYAIRFDDADMPVVQVVYEEFVTSDGEVLKPGTYLFYTEDSEAISFLAVKSLRISGYTGFKPTTEIKKIDPKYLPKGGVGYGESHTFKWAYTENTEGLVVVGDGLIKVSSLTPSIEELEGGTLSAVHDGSVTTITLTNGTTLIGLDGVTLVAEAMLVVYRDNYSNEELAPGMIFPEKGVYMANIEGMTIELSYGTIHKIDPKYLPGGSIRLDAYKDNDGTNLSETILILAMNGGGVKTYDSGYEKLWEDILRIQPTHIILTTGCDASVAINILSADRAADASQWFASGTGVFVMDGLALTITAVLSATADAKGATVSVLAEPITFPQVEVIDHDVPL